MFSLLFLCLRRLAGGLLLLFLAAIAGGLAVFDLEPLLRFGLGYLFFDLLGQTVALFWVETGSLPASYLPTHSWPLYQQLKFQWYDFLFDEFGPSNHGGWVQGEPIRGRFVYEHIR